MLYEIRFHGRGGQGAVTAAELLVKAANIEGKWGQSIPFFGAERRGAPTTASSRFSDGRLSIHSQVYNPDLVVVLDKKILDVVDVTHGLKKEGSILFNTPSPFNAMRFSSYKIWWVNATKIAEELGLKMAGWTIVNTAMLGGVVKIFNWIRLNSLIEAIKSNWGGQVGELNAKAAKKAFEEAQTV